MNNRNNKTWSEEENNLLSELWGSVSVPGIAKKLGRTSGSVSQQARRLGLGSFTDNGDFVTFYQLILSFGYPKGSYSTIKRLWIDNKGLPVKTVKVNNSRVLVVNIEKFWKWAEFQRNSIKFTRLKPLSLGAEPSWVEEQRMVERKRHVFKSNTIWNDYDIERLKFYVRNNSHNLEELSSIFGRSEESLALTIKDLGLSLPNPRNRIYRYTDDEFSTICDLIISGHNIADIAQIILIPQHSLRNYISRKFGTSNVDKIHKILKGEGK